MTRLRHVAPAGAPIGAGDLGRWTRTLVSRGDLVEPLRAVVAARLGARHCHAACSGRAGLTILLRAMRELVPAGRSEVVIPSYTCFSVPASVVRAGLTPRIVDVVPETLDYDYARLEREDLSRAVAIVATNLYGLPSDLPRLSALARSAGVFLVDDAAQALGAEVGGRPCGTWGDAGLISFDKGKSVSAVEGGMVLTDSGGLDEAITRQVRALPERSARAAAGAVVRIAGYAAFLRPRLYWIPNAMPQLGLGRTIYTTAFDIESCAPAVAALAAVVFARLDEFTRSRRHNAMRLAGSLGGVAGVVLPRPCDTADPCYLRFPLLLPDTGSRDRLIALLAAAGIGATASYPEAIVDIPELKGRIVGDTGAPGGRDVARRIVTLPTHPYVAPRDLATMAETIAHALRPARAMAAPALARQ